MIKKLPELWLQYATDDLRSAEALMKAEIFNMVCFHSQQVVEKLFKAVIAFYKQPIPRIHNLSRLCKMSEDLHKAKLGINDERLLFLNDIYIDSRYPTDFGILPDGLPNENDAAMALKYAKAIYEIIQPIIKI